MRRVNVTAARLREFIDKTNRCVSLVLFCLNNRRPAVSRESGANKLRPILDAARPLMDLSLMHNSIVGLSVPGEFGWRRASCSVGPTLKTSVRRQAPRFVSDLLHIDVEEGKEVAQLRPRLFKMTRQIRARRWRKPSLRKVAHLFI